MKTIVILFSRARIYRVDIKKLCGSERKNCVGGFLAFPFIFSPHRKKCPKKFVYLKKVLYVCDMENKEKYLNPTEFAAKAGVSVTSVYNYISRGEIDYLEKRRGLKKVKVISEKELEKFK